MSAPVRKPLSPSKQRKLQIARDLTIGPQRVGGRYRCAYWGKEYTVDDIRYSGRPGMETVWFDVTWEDGRVTSHCTPWDRRDRIISQPADPTVA